MQVQNTIPIQEHPLLQSMNLMLQETESLKKLQITAKGDKNIMPDIIHCVKNKCTLGEISDTLRLIFGEHY